MFYCIISNVWKPNRSQRSPLTFVMSLTTIFHCDIILMRYSSPLQQCNVVTSRFVNLQQRLKKRRMSVPGSRLCCRPTGTGNYCLKAEGDRSLDGISVLVVGRGQETLSIVSDSTGERHDLHTLVSLRNSTYGIATQGFGSLRQERRGSWEAIYLPLHHMPSKYSWQRYSCLQLAIRLG